MPSLFSRAFSCTSGTSCTVEDVPKSPSFPVASTPTSNSRLGRILRAGFDFSIIKERNRGSGTAHVVVITHECKPRLSETRLSSHAASEVSSVPSLSRLDSTVSSVSAASAPSLVPPPVRKPLNNDDIICTLKGMQAWVPESPRISHRNSLPPMSLEGEDVNSSRRPSYSFNIPQLYPYTLSEDDLWAEEMVANILADHSGSRSSLN